MRPHVLVLEWPQGGGRETMFDYLLVLWRYLTFGEEEKKCSHHLHQLLQEGHQLQQLIVVLIHEPALDGNPVRQLVDGWKKNDTSIIIVKTAPAATPGWRCWWRYRSPLWHHTTVLTAGKMPTWRYFRTFLILQFNFQYDTDISTLIIDIISINDIRTLWLIHTFISYFIVWNVRKAAWVTTQSE